MLLSTQSPKGGMPLTGLWAGGKEGRNTVIDSDPEPKIIDDFLVYKIGYTVKDLKEGEGIFIKRSEAKKLLKIIMEGFGVGFCQCGGVKEDVCKNQ